MISRPSQLLDANDSGIAPLLPPLLQLPVSPATEHSSPVGPSTSSRFNSLIAFLRSLSLRSIETRCSFVRSVSLRRFLTLQCLSRCLMNMRRFVKDSLQNAHFSLMLISKELFSISLQSICIGRHPYVWYNVYSTISCS